MKISDLIKILIGIAILWVGWQFARPYWDKYWFSKEIEKSATMGIKRGGEERTRELITAAFADLGVNKTGQDCYVFLDERRIMTVRCQYEAKVVIFGELLHTYKMKVEISKKEEINKYL